MRTQSLILSAFLVAVVAGVAWAQHQSPLVEFPPAKGMARAGACQFPIDGWVTVDCSNVSAASSSALNSWSRYVVQCGVDSYVAWGDASTDAADSGDGYIPTGSWLEFVTTDTVKYFSCLNIGSDSNCKLIECK